MFAAAAAVAVVDWAAVGADRSTSDGARRFGAIEAVAKPGVVLLLIVVAVVADDVESRALVVLALVASLAGDIALLPQVDRFLAGLGAFLASHMLWLAALLTLDLDRQRILVTVVVLLLPFGAMLLRLRGTASTPGSSVARLLPWIGIYGLVLVAMAATAVGAGSATLAAGGLAFALSDSILAYRRFLSDGGHMLRVATHVTYHGALALLVLGFATSG